jgi:hypothetical protein
MSGLYIGANDFRFHRATSEWYVARVRGIGWVLSAIAASGCGFQVSGSAPGIDAQPDAGSGSDMLPDAPPADAAPERNLYAASDTMLYELDVDLKTATLVGRITQGPTAFDVGGLAFDGTNIIGLSDDGSELLTIDPNTAAVTARRAISPAGTYYGLTVAPAGEAGPTAVVFAGATGSKLVTIDPVTGTATTVGMYGGGMIFYTDLAWVNGVGLFITLQNGSCSPRCFARLDHTTGVASPIRYNLSANVYGLSGYRGMLWALHNEGAVMLVNQVDGIMTNLGFDPDIPWTEAAQ